MLKKIASNTLSQVFSKVITALITIFLLGIITNYLTVELFGSYNMIFNYIFIFAFLVDLGLYAITVKEISANKEKSSYIFGNILTLRVLSALLVIILSYLIALFLPGYNETLILSGIIIASIFTFFSLINSSLLALMQAHMKIEFSIISVVLNKLFVLASTFITVKYLFPNPEVTGFDTAFLMIIAIVSAGMFLNMILNYFYARTITKIKFHFDLNYIKEIFFKSLPYGIALFLSVVYTKIDIILLSLMEKGIIAETSIALYSLPLKIMDVFMIIGGFFMNSLLPSISENHKKGDKNKLQLIVRNGLKVMFATGAILVSLGMVFKDYIVRIIANEDYLKVTEINSYTSSDAFSVVLFMILFFYLGIVFSYFLIGVDKQKKLLKISIVLTLINIVGNIALIPIWSFVGAGIVTVITQIVFLFLVYREANKEIKLSLPYAFILKTSIIGTIIYFGANYITTNYSFGLYLDLIYGIIFFLIFIAIIGKEEYKAFKKLKKAS